MKKRLSIFYLFLSILFSAQNLENKITNEICHCIEKIGKENLIQEHISDCIMYTTDSYRKEISSKLQDTTNDNIKSVNNYIKSLITKLSSNCKTFFDFATRYSSPPPEQKSISDCEDLKIGAYYYKIAQGKYLDYLIFTKEKMIEIRPNNVYAIYNIKWLNNCSYELKLEDSNSHYDDVNMKGKILKFRIIENTEDYFMVQTEFFQKGNTMNIKVYKLGFDLNPIKKMFPES